MAQAVGVQAGAGDPYSPAARRMTPPHGRKAMALTLYNRPKVGACFRPRTELIKTFILSADKHYLANDSLENPIANK